MVTAQVNLAFGLVTHRNGECTTQSRFRSCDPPWPISVRRRARLVRIISVHKFLAILVTLELLWPVMRCYREGQWVRCVSARCSNRCLLLRRLPTSPFPHSPFPISLSELFCSFTSLYRLAVLWYGNPETDTNSTLDKMITNKKTKTKQAI